MTVQKVWTLDDGGKAVASVQVELLRDGKRYAVMELNEKNDWQYTWEQLDGKYEWSVVEGDVPEGFTSTVSQKENIWTITNDDISEPTDPQNPTDPQKPENPQQPVDPQKPTDSQKPTNPEQPADPSNPSDQPKTGDRSNLLLWTVILAISGAGIVSIAIYSRKKRDNK